MKKNVKGMALILMSTLFFLSCSSEPRTSAEGYWKLSSWNNWDNDPTCSGANVHAVSLTNAYMVLSADNTGYMFEIKNQGQNDEKCYPTENLITWKYADNAATIIIEFGSINNPDSKVRFNGYISRSEDDDSAILTLPCTKTSATDSANTISTIMVFESSKFDQGCKP